MRRTPPGARWLALTLLTSVGASLAGAQTAQPIDQEYTAKI